MLHATHQPLLHSSSAMEKPKTRLILRGANRKSQMYITQSCPAGVLWWHLISQPTGVS